MPKLLFIIFIILGLLFPRSAAAKSYSIDGVNITAQIKTDGSMTVEEVREYSFDGSFSFAYQTIKNTGERTEKYLLRDFRLCDEKSCYRQLNPSEVAGADTAKPNATFYVLNQANQYYVKWFYRAQNSNKSFKLSYVVTNAITLHADTAELYWQLVGADWEIGQSQIKANIFLPNGISDNQIQAWAHGSLAGLVTIPAADLVNHEVAYLPVGQFFESRILLPKEIFTKGALGSLSRAVIAQQEAGFIAQTEQKQKRTAFLKNLTVPASFFLMILALGVFYRRLKLFWRYGKDRPLPAVNLAGRIWEPPSDIDPAQVEQLLNGTEKLTPKAFTATVLSLIQDRFYKLTRSAQKEGLIFKNYHFYLTRVTAKKTPSPIQAQAIRFLDRIGHKNLDLTEIVSWCRENRVTSAKFFTKSFPEMTLQENLDEGYFEIQSHQQKEKLSDFFILGLLIFAQFLLTALSLSFDSLAGTLAGGAGLTLMITLFVGAGLTSHFGEKRTEKGRLETAGWLAFKKHLAEYNQTKNDPIDSLVLWEKYLIYGTVLGISAKTISQLPIQFSTADQAQIIAYWGSGQAGDFTGSLADISGAVSGLASAASSSYGASGVGSSGGASGGGGGGGGGAG